MTQPAPTPGDPAPTPTPQPTPPGDPAPAPTDPPDAPLGPPGLRALQAEREARERLEREFAPLRPLLAALGGQPAGDGRTDLERLNERLVQHESDLSAERTARWRAEVAHERGLTPGQASRLRGDTREALLADADDLLAAFPAPPADPPRPGPRPDPAQGPRPGEKASSLEAGRSLYAERHKPKTSTTT